MWCGKPHWTIQSLMSVSNRVEFVSESGRQRYETRFRVFCEICLRMGPNKRRRHRIPVKKTNVTPGICGNSSFMSLHFRISVFRLWQRSKTTLPSSEGHIAKAPKLSLQKVGGSPLIARFKILLGGVLWGSHVGALHIASLILEDSPRSPSPGR